MLWRRQDAKNLASQMSGGKKETVLRALAYSMMDGRVADLPRDNLIAVIGPVLRRQARRVTAEDFLADVVTSGMLIERETEQFAFAHHTFQEYLSAGYIRDSALVNVLADAVGDPWWRETTLLYAARSDADPIIAACLSADSPIALGLAFECVDQDSAFDPALHARLDELLSSVYDSGSDPSRRRLMAGVLLTRRLREQIRTPNSHRLCVHPITYGIYDLFRAETGAPGPDAKSGDGPTEDAIVGVRGSDATAFTEWANAITGGPTTYRLPTRDSLDRQMERQAKSGPLAGQPVNCVWADDSVGQERQKPLLWVPRGMPNPQKSGRRTLRSAIENDITETIPPSMLEVFGTGLILMPGVVSNIHSPLQASDPELAMTRAYSYDTTLESTLETVASFSDILKGASFVNDKFSSEFSVDLSLSLCVVLARMLLRAEKRARILRRDLIPQVSGVLVRDLQGALGQTRALVTRLASEFARDHATFEQAEDASIYKIPDSLADSIVSASAQAHAAVALPRALATALSRNAGIDDEEWNLLIDLDRLSEDLHNAVQQYSQALPELEGGAPDSRLKVIANNLWSDGGSVFVRDVGATPAVSTSIRLAALLLAGEMNKTTEARLWQYSTTAKLQSRNEATVLYRDVVAGITWLERRINGSDPATEMIMLAIE